MNQDYELVKSNEYWDKREQIFSDLKAFTKHNFIVDYKIDKSITLWIFEPNKAFKCYLLFKDGKFCFSQESLVIEFFQSSVEMKFLEWMQYLFSPDRIEKNDISE